MILKPELRISAVVLLFMLTLLSSCGTEEKTESKSPQYAGQKTTAVPAPAESIKNPESHTVSPANPMIIHPAFTDKMVIEPVFTEISRIEYLQYRKNTKSSCPEFPEDRGLSHVRDCDEICEDYLKDDASGKQLLLPADYDQGVLGINTSPNCRRFLVYSSYDLPEYNDYYAQRAEIFGFNLTNEPGLNAFKPAFIIDSNDWSIESLFMPDDNTIVIKTYSGRSNEKESDFIYYKTHLRTGVSKTGDVKN